MRTKLRLAWVLPLAALSSAALGQALGGSPAASTGSSSSLGIRGPGMTTVPNNSLAPLPGSVGGTTTLPATPGLNPATPGLNPATPGLNPATPGLNPSTPGLSTTTPGLLPSTPTPGIAATPGAIIELPPPSVAPSTPTTPAPGGDAFRTCPPGLAFC